MEIFSFLKTALKHTLSFRARLFHKTWQGTCTLRVLGVGLRQVGSWGSAASPVSRWDAKLEGRYRLDSFEHDKILTPFFLAGLGLGMGFVLPSYLFMQMLRRKYGIKSTSSLSWSSFYHHLTCPLLLDLSNMRVSLLRNKSFSNRTIAFLICNRVRTFKSRLTDASVSKGTRAL